MQAALKELGLSTREAEKMTAQVTEYLKKLPPERAWQEITGKILTRPYPFSVHQLLYRTTYPQWEKMPAPAWFPDEKIIKNSHIASWMNERGFKNTTEDYPQFHRWSVKQYPDFWQKIVALFNIHFDKPYTTLVDISASIENPKWFPHARLNIINSCFQAKKNNLAIISQNQQGKITKTRYEELDKLSNRIANNLLRYLKKGDKAAIVMPMTREAVALFLGIIKAGCIVAAIPDSFAVEEIAIRLKISDSKIVFCQDQIVRDGKVLPLYEKIVNAQGPLTVVLPVGKKIGVMLKVADLAWNDFLMDDDVFASVSCEPQEHISILFSSGTTGDPKGIPWDHTTALKCASDAYLHHDLHPGDIFCWPSNLGWMMGPWLIFACLLNKATIALYEDSPTGRNFGKFIEHTKVTHLGVVPTLVRTWRNTACMQGLHWKSIKLFTSTGERSNTDDMLYLMSLAHYRPIIEYCGGTEIAGAYITGTVVQPAAPAACTTAALGIDFVLLDESDLISDSGEVMIIPPSIGLSTQLINKDHHLIYYAHLPKLADGRILRRHGDYAQRYANGYYRLLGRIDDTMKLSGIKISSAEIENTLNLLPAVSETAAIAINPPEGGPTELVIYAVLNPNKTTTASNLKIDMQKQIKEHLNPLFKIDEVILIPNLPRTASNKVMRRVLRAEYKKIKFKPAE